MKIKNKVNSLFGDKTMIRIKDGKVVSECGLTRTNGGGTKYVIDYMIRRRQERRGRLENGLYMLHVETKKNRVYHYLSKVF